MARPARQPPSLIEANQAAALLWGGVDPELLEPPINMLRLAVHPGGLPKISSMTAACNAPLITKLGRNLAIETFLPMDERSAARLGELSAKARGE